MKPSVSPRLSRTSGIGPALLLVFTLLYAQSAPAWKPVPPKSQDPKAQEQIEKALAATTTAAGLEETDRAIKHFEKALEADPGNDAVLIALAGAYFSRGYQMPVAGAEAIQARVAYFEKGYAAAEKALALRESAGAHAWLAANLGAAKQFSNFMSQAAILPEVNDHLDWITAHDKDYGYGLAARFWTGVMTRAPDVIVRMLGEDPQQIAQDLDAAIAAEPRYLENVLYQAELLHSLTKTADALALLDRVLAADPAAWPEERVSNLAAQADARNFWKQWTGKDYPQR